MRDLGVCNMEYLAHVRKSDGEQQSVRAHLHGVSRRAGLYAAKIGLQSFGELLGLTHDLGKCSKEFSDYIRSAAGITDPDAEDYVDSAGLRGKIDHSTAGAQHVFALLAAQGSAGQIAGTIAALCMVSHHSGLIDCLTPVGTDGLSKRLAKHDRLTHLAEALHNADAAVRDRIRRLANDREMVRALIRKCSEVQQGLGPQIGDFNIGFLVRFLFSCLIDADGIDTADFESPIVAKKRMDGLYTSWPVLVARLDQALDAFQTRTPIPIDEIRKDISRHCFQKAQHEKGIFTLTVPTGGGKTLASLRFAMNHAMHHQMDRIIIVVPFTTIIDQNADVVRLVLEPKGTDQGMVVLEHHSNLMPEKQTWRNKMLSQDWEGLNFVEYEH
jgi:CRISPR-associated endonuclease/helicase Cas3